MAVVGDGRANVYAGGNVTFHHQAAVDVQGDRAPALWLFVRSDREVSFMNHARYQGVVYGPGPPGVPGADISLDDHASVFGALAGNVVFISNHYSIHYDEAVASVDSIIADQSVPSLSYLHVTSNEVTVESP